MIARSASSPISHVRRVSAVRLELARHEVAARDLELLLRRVAGQLDDLHAVAQRPGIVSSTFAVQMNITCDRSYGTPR
jgi:hypothetical protein